MRRIPLTAAKDLANDYDLSQVILVAFDRTDGSTHVVTYGRTIQDTRQASEGADWVMHAMGWRTEVSSVRLGTQHSQARSIGSRTTSDRPKAGVGTL